jgi:hypothetical protein
MKTKTNSYLIIALVICFNIMFGVVSMAQIDSTAIVNTYSIGEQISNTLIPHNAGGAIANTIITSIGMIIPIIIHWIKKRKANKI